VTRDDVRAHVRALVAEAVTAHAAVMLGLPAAARRCAETVERLAALVVAGIPADAVDRVDADYPAAEDDPAAWARLALGIRSDDDDPGREPAGPT